MTALPAKNVLDGSTAPLTSAMKAAMGQIRDFLSETLGAVGGKVSVQSTDTFDPLNASTTAGIHVQGNGVSGVGAYGGAITLAQTGGSTRPGAGVASVQSTADPDQCGIAFLVHGSALSNNQLQQVGEIDATGLAEFQCLSTGNTAVTSPTAADGNVFSGTYTPTLTATTNVAASTAYATQYSRVGSVVTVSGRIAVTCTSVAAFEIGISLPVASNFSDVYQASGVLCSARNGGIVFGNATLDRAQGQSYPVGTGSEAYFYSFTYRVI